MKILQLCKKFPFPLKDGELLAINYLSKAYHELGAEVTLLAMNTSKHFFSSVHLPDDFNHYQSIYFAEVDNKLSAKDAFLNLFSQESYHISRFVSPSFEKVLIQILTSKSFDVIQLETLYLAPYIPIIKAHSDAKIVMRAHNVEFEIWERISANTSNGLKKWYLTHLVEKLKRFEIKQLSNYDVLMPITERDGKMFKSLGYNGKMIVTPIGLDNRDYLADDACYKKPLTLSFIGSLDWVPNLEGVNYFIKDIWPQLKKSFPQLEFHIAGRNTPKEITNLKQKGIHIHGEVEDAKQFINQHPIMVVPLLSGSGMRAKILEGMALGRVIITSQLGLEGIAAKHMEHVIVANNLEEYLSAFKFCNENPDKILEIGNRAQVFVAKNYDNLEIARKALTALRAVERQAQMA